jgi:hypothetical protein
MKWFSGWEVGNSPGFRLLNTDDMFQVIAGGRVSEVDVPCDLRETQAAGLSHSLDGSGDCLPEVDVMYDVRPPIRLRMLHHPIYLLFSCPLEWIA